MFHSITILSNPELRATLANIYCYPGTNMLYRHTRFMYMDLSYDMISSLSDIIHTDHQGQWWNFAQKLQSSKFESYIRHLPSAEINAELVCPLRTPNFPPGTHYYDPKRHDLIEGVSKCMISGQEAQAKFNEYREAQGSHDEVYTDGSKMNEKVEATAVINRHFQNGETTCRQLSKRLPDNSTIFAAEATAISLALNYHQHMDPVHHDVVIYSDSMSCLQAIEGGDTENPFICHIMNLLWSLSDKGTRVRFCWVPSHCGIVGNERVDQLAKETLDQDTDPLASVHYTDMKPLVNSYIQKLVQTKWDVSVHGRDLYLGKPTLGPPKEFQHLTRAEEVVNTRLRIGHTKATKSHILSRGPPTGCHHCGQTLTINHMLLECALLQECRDKYYTVDSLNALFETIPETCIVEFLREAGSFYLIWCNLLISTSPQTSTIWSDLSNCLDNESKSEAHLFTCMGRLFIDFSKTDQGMQLHWGAPQLLDFLHH